MMTGAEGGGGTVPLGGAPRSVGVRTQSAGVGAQPVGASPQPAGVPPQSAGHDVTPELGTGRPPDDHPSPPSISAAQPADDAELARIVREAAASRTPLRIAGAGRWLDAGRPVAAARRVGLHALTGIVEYVPGDLTMTARAGTPLAHLQDAARAEGQFLPLDPWGDDAGTLGATLATATAGPLAGALGLPRDIVLGVSVVTGDGEILRAGGRVVKNVAGFDLVRLMVGAWGTLGAITQATVRLRALPERDETLSIAAPAESAHDALAIWLDRFRAARVQPLAAELLDPALARALEVGDGHDRCALLVRIAGNADAVAAQRAVLAELGDLVARPASIWTRLRAAEPAGGAVLRLAALPTALPHVWRTARELAERARDAASGPAGHAVTHATTHAVMNAVMNAVVHATVARGVVRVCLPAMDERALHALLGDAAPERMTRRFERLPAALWPRLAPSAVSGALSRGVRRAFDPHAILNPGILGAEDGRGAHGANPRSAPELT